MNSKFSLLRNQNSKNLLLSVLVRKIEHVLTKIITHLSCPQKKVS